MLNRTIRRTETRTACNISVEVLRESGARERGMIIDYSTKGVALLIEGRPQKGEAMLVSAPEIGERTGRVVRTFTGGVALSLDPIAMPVNTGNNFGALTGAEACEADGLEKRRHERLDCKVQTTVHIDALGVNLFCVLANMSQSGCLLQSDDKPAIGTAVIVGKRHGIVRRHVESGFAVEFATIAQSPSKPKTPSGCIAA